MNAIEWFLLGFVVAHLLVLMVVFSFYFDLRTRLEYVEDMAHWHGAPDNLSKGE